MKKIMIFVFCIVLLSSFLSFFSFAEKPVDLTLSGDTVYAGDEITLNLYVSDNSQISGAVIDLNYDKTKLEFISASEGAILDAKAQISIRPLKNGNIRFAYMSPSSSIISEGVLFSVTFKALEDAVGKTEVSVSIPNPGDFVSSDLTKLPFNIKNASVNIVNHQTGESVTEETAENTTNEQPLEESTENQSEVESTEAPTEIPDDNKDKIIPVILFVVGLVIIIALILQRNIERAKKRNK